MIKIGTITTVWKRPIISTLHFQWMDSFRQACKEMNVRLSPFYILSDNDPNLSVFKRQLEAHELNYTVNGCKRLSDKSQAGLEVLREQADFDWLMHLDSDEFITKRLMDQWLGIILSPFGPLWWGASGCSFLDISSKKAYAFKGYSDHPVKNGGTIMSRQILEAVGWELWPASRNSGLNIMERRHLENKGCKLVAYDTKPPWNVLEVKGSGTAIHELKWFKKRNNITELNQADQRALLRDHPIMKNLIP